MEREYLTREISDGQLQKIVAKGKLVFLRRYPDISVYVATYRRRYFVLERWNKAGWWKDGAEVSRENFTQEIIEQAGSREKALQILRSFDIPIDEVSEDRILKITEV